jgi:bacterioferritin-associated ferredoxin
MILCQCAGVSDATVCRVIREGAASVSDVTRRCGAGRCCAPCREEIAALLGALRAEAHTPPSEAGSSGGRQAAA